MKILYLCPDYGIPVLGHKGAAVHVREMAAAFSRAGHAVVVVAPVANKSPWEEPSQLQTRFLRLPASETLQSAFHNLKTYTHLLGVSSPVPGELRRILYDQEFESELLRCFHTEPPDLIYVRASVFSTAGARLAREWQRPLLVELNAPLAKEQSAYRAGGFDELATAAERLLLTQADAVLAVSGALHDHVVALGVDSQRVHVFPNGIDPGQFFPGLPDPELRMRYGLGEGPLLGFVGGLRPWHGVHALPDLLQKLAARDRRARMAIVGDGPLRSELEHTFERMGLRDQVAFTGAVPHGQVAPLIRHFDVALAPYPALDHDFYFSPLKLFEYMACGIPVVAPKVGQIAEVVRDGQTGVLYPLGDVEAFTAACEELLGAPALRKQIGLAAADEVRSHYTWDHNARRAIELALALRCAS